MWPASTSTQGRVASIARTRAMRLRSTTSDVGLREHPAAHAAPGAERNERDAPPLAQRTSARELLGGRWATRSPRPMLRRPAPTDVACDGAARGHARRRRGRRRRRSCGARGARFAGHAGRTYPSRYGQTLAGALAAQPAANQCGQTRSSVARRSSRLTGLSRCSTPAGARIAETTTTATARKSRRS